MNWRTAKKYATPHNWNLRPRPRRPHHPVLGPYRAHRREILVGDLTDLDRLAARRRRWMDWDKADEACEEEERLPVAWLSFLSLREAACLFAYERGMTYSAIARELGIRRGTVQAYVERAREKLARTEGVQLGLFDENLNLGV